MDLLHTSHYLWGTKVRFIKQWGHAPKWIGGFQTQLSSSMFYVNVIFMGMSVGTFWYTAGYQIKASFAPWLHIWMIPLAGLIVLGMVMIIDWAIILPSRMAFNNEQSCKHENPGMDLMRQILAENTEMRKDIAELKAELRIDPEKL